MKVLNDNEMTLLTKLRNTKPPFDDVEDGDDFDGDDIDDGGDDEDEIREAASPFLISVNPYILSSEIGDAARRCASNNTHPVTPLTAAAASSASSSAVAASSSTTSSLGAVAAATPSPGGISTPYLTPASTLTPFVTASKPKQQQKQQQQKQQRGDDRVGEGCDREYARRGSSRVVD